MLRTVTTTLKCFPLHSPSTPRLLHSIPAIFFCASLRFSLCISLLSSLVACGCWLQCGNAKIKYDVMELLCYSKRFSPTPLLVRKCNLQACSFRLRCALPQGGPEDCHRPGPFEGALAGDLSRRERREIPDTTSLHRPRDTEDDSGSLAACQLQRHKARARRAVTHRVLAKIRLDCARAFSSGSGLVASCQACHMVGHVVVVWHSLVY